MSTPRADSDGILELLHDESWERAAAAVREWHPADIAELIEEAPEEARRPLFDRLPEDIKPDVLAEFDTDAGAEVLESLTNDEISTLVEEMAPDDAADVLADLPEERSASVLSLMEKEDSDDVRRLLEYEEDTAGGIMTTDVVAMRENQTVEEAIQAIAYLDTDEKFYHANLVDAQNRLVGHVEVWDLLRERNRNRPLSELADRDFTAVTVDTDQEEVARLMQRYDLDVVPVVDPAGRLVGRITSDDVLDVVEEEASEDILRMAGSDDSELEGPSILRSCAVRLPWLFITLLGSVFTSFILRHYHAYIRHLMALAAFVPAVLAMGGNTGIQSSTLMVRSLALGTVRRRRVAAILLREMLTGALMGLACGLIIGLASHFVMLGHDESMTLSAMGMGITVATALFSAMTFAAFFGALVPMVLDRLRIDPAMASGPFISVANDISALLIYFAVTVSMVSRLL
jgi:magnesium transporter